MKKIVESDIRWRGSVTDLATDCAYLLTRAETTELALTLLRFTDSERLTEQKCRGAGRIEVEEPTK